MGIAFIVFGVIVVLAAAIGPLSVLMGVDRVCGPSEKVGEHDPIEAMEGRGVRNRHGA